MMCSGCVSEGMEKALFGSAVSRHTHGCLVVPRARISSNPSGLEVDNAVRVRCAKIITSDRFCASLAAKARVACGQGSTPGRT